MDVTLLTLLNQQISPGKGRGVDPRAADDRRPGSKLPVTKYNFWVGNIATDGLAKVSNVTERKRDWLIDKVALYKRVCEDASTLTGLGLLGS